MHRSHMYMYVLFLKIEIESGRLMFRRDLSPVADVGLRQDLLDMLLLNYSHNWLRIGLEVLYVIQYIVYH